MGLRGTDRIAVPPRSHVFKISEVGNFQNLIEVLMPKDL